MQTDIDRHVGERLRRRRRLMGLTQKELAERVGIRFQQIHKYETGINRMTASRLYELARALGAPVEHFYEGLNGEGGMKGAQGDLLARRETLELVRAYYRLGRAPRQRLLDLAKTLQAALDPAGPATDTRQV
ncbi:MAG: helix-turn-helix transcriptional regulator [Oceanicaulis sp.]|uniref:helix-turn-helix domain-containing protein n=1 Tax=Glycocaulis sp. TaxID=1969725 RepID=UPI0025BB7B84|nr:helix-turn-helix transcriptional regulator [Glycocaulis sp.]MCC5980307.1 helix-turn-helix transcriptional regulator [Oceanicaulis sp.]MCH8521558.1 helix-turn-helix transcriptional regulator [Glycocaulis sp.]